MTFQIYTDVNFLPSDWDHFGKDIFLQRPYLTAQENGTPANMDYFYVAVYENGEIIAKTVVQRIRVKGKNLFNAENKSKDELISLLNVNLLCVGNIKLTGEHAWELRDNRHKGEFLNLLPSILKEIRAQSKKENLPVQLVLIKDFYEQTSLRLAHHFDKYEMLSVQPNMIFKPEKTWKSFDDYLAAMRTKYRTRAKRAFKKSAEVNFRELGLSETKALQSKMFELYLNVLQNNGFSLYKLPENFFYEMKNEMPENFKIFGGFIQDELICFYSIIENNTGLEAGFLGYNADLQQEKQLYLNMLYQMNAYTISNDFESIDFSRTAMEIKSSVGAEPYEMYGFLRHTNPVMNRVLRATFKKFYQPEEWIPRNPFKD